jgi:peptidoglycan-associated lipoprotein
MRHAFRSLVVVGTFASFGIGCRSTKPLLAPAADSAPVTGSSQSDHVSTSGGPVADSLVSIVTAPTTDELGVLSARIFFAYDEDALSAAAVALLERKLPVLQRYASITLRIDGHCDERGSDEYNIALGRRRALAIMRYFTDRGIDSLRLATASFGREIPLVPSVGEESWAMNRRAEFQVQGIPAIVGKAPLFIEGNTNRF